MNTKSFQEYLEKRLTKEEIAEIEKQAKLEVRAFKKTKEKNKFLKKRVAYFPAVAHSFEVYQNDASAMAGFALFLAEFIMSLSNGRLNSL